MLMAMLSSSREMGFLRGTHSWRRKLHAADEVKRSAKAGREQASDGRFEQVIDMPMVRSPFP